MFFPSAALWRPPSLYRLASCCPRGAPCEPDVSAAGEVDAADRLLLPDHLRAHRDPAGAVLSVLRVSGGVRQEPDQTQPVHPDDHHAGTPRRTAVAVGVERKSESKKIDCIKNKIIQKNKTKQ